MSSAPNVKSVIAGLRADLAASQKESKRLREERDHYREKALGATLCAECGHKARRTFEEIVNAVGDLPSALASAERPNKSKHYMSVVVTYTVLDEDRLVRIESLKQFGIDIDDHSIFEKIQAVVDDYEAGGL